MSSELDPVEGAILLVDKPLEWTSFNAVSKIRAALRAVTGKRVKVGHAGTLDPLATGLLVIGTGKCTKQLEELTGHNKVYVATLCLGKTTASYDAETPVSEERPWEHITEAMIRSALEGFRGPIMQQPPDYSAKRVGGKRAYQLARAGEKVHLEPRPVVIHRLELLSNQGNEVVIEVEASKGTYIRSLAHDIGAELGCGAHLTALRRTASGPYHVRDARTPEQWSAWFDRWAEAKTSKPAEEPPG